MALSNDSTIWLNSGSTLFGWRQFIDLLWLISGMTLPIIAASIQSSERCTTSIASSKKLTVGI